MGLAGLLASCSLRRAIDSTTFRRGFSALGLSLLSRLLLRLRGVEPVAEGSRGEKLDEEEGRSVEQASQMRYWRGLTRVQMSQVQVSGGRSGRAEEVKSMMGGGGLVSLLMAGGGCFVAVGPAARGSFGFCFKAFSMLAWTANNGWSCSGGEDVARLPAGLLSVGGR